MSPHGKSRVWFVLFPVKVDSVKRGSPWSTDLPSWEAQAEPTRSFSQSQRSVLRPKMMPEEPSPTRQPWLGRIVLGTEKFLNGKDMRITKKWKPKPDILKERRQIFLRRKSLSFLGQAGRIVLHHLLVLSDAFFKLLFDERAIQTTGIILGKSGVD